MESMKNSHQPTTLRAPDSLPERGENNKRQSAIARSSPPLSRGRGRRIKKNRVNTYTYKIIHKILTGN